MITFEIILCLLVNLRRIACFLGFIIIKFRFYLCFIKFVNFSFWSSYFEIKLDWFSFEVPKNSFIVMIEVGENFLLILSFCLLLFAPSNLGDVFQSFSPGLVRTSRNQRLELQSFLQAAKSLISFDFLETSLLLLKFHFLPLIKLWIQLWPSELRQSIHCPLMIDCSFHHQYFDGLKIVILRNYFDDVVGYCSSY